MFLQFKWPEKEKRSVGCQKKPVLFSTNLGCPKKGPQMHTQIKKAVGRLGALLFWFQLITPGF
jgi:hypothetical protein